MANKKGFNDRVEEAKAAAHFVSVLRRDERNRPTILSIPGHEGKRYTVVLVRDDVEKTVRVKCLHSGNVSDICEGNYRSVCYHSFAAILFSVKEAGYSVRIFDNEADAKKAGKASDRFQIVGHTSGKVFFAVLKKLPEKVKKEKK